MPLMMPRLPGAAHHFDEKTAPIAARAVPTAKLHTKAAFLFFFPGQESTMDIHSFSFSFPKAVAAPFSKNKKSRTVTPRFFHNAVSQLYF